MSDLKSIILKSYDEHFKDTYEAFNNYIEMKIIEGRGYYRMDKYDYYNFCNTVNENNSAKRYLFRTKRFCNVVLNLPIVAIYDHEINPHLINYIGRKFKPSTELMYCIKRFCEEHPDVRVSRPRINNFKGLVFKIK